MARLQTAQHGYSAEVLLIRHSVLVFIRCGNLRQIGVNPFWFKACIHAQHVHGIGLGRCAKFPLPAVPNAQQIGSVARQTFDPGSIKATAVHESAGDYNRAARIRLEQNKARQ